MEPLTTGTHHAVPMDAYHGPCTPGPGVSASDLKRIIPSLKGRCPQWALHRWSHNPARLHDDDTDAMSLGTAAHTLILDGEAVFEARYTRKPDGMNFSTKEGKAWRADAESAGKEVLSSAAYDSCVAMAEAVYSHKAASKLLTGGHPEVTAIAQDPHTGLWLKARPDYLRPGIAINLKTALSAELEAFQRQSWSLGYHVSAAVTADVMALLGQQIAYAYVIVEKDAPHCVAVRTMEAGWLEAGRTLYRGALNTYAACVASGEWPAYGDAAEDMPLPPWSAPQMQRIYADAQAPQPFPKQEAA